MDIRTYQRVWGTLKNHSSKRGYFPTPSISFTRHSNLESITNVNSLTRYSTNYELKKALQTAQD